jgi:dynein heavy chain
MDHGGWYDRKDKEQAFMNLINLQFVAAMGPPGGGRTRITQRYVRHYNVVGFVPFDRDSMSKVFTAVVSWCLDPYPSSIKSLGSALVAATVDMYETISAEMLPTPTKSHYTFNLRDLSKVFLGVSMSSPDAIEDDKAMVRLWAHECSRVFYDRLVSDADRGWFNKTLGAKCKEHFKKDWNTVRVCDLVDRCPGPSVVCARLVRPCLRCLWRLLT